MTKNILIVESRYYKDVASMLLDAAVSEINKYKYQYKTIDVHGALEIPILISKAIKEDKYDGFIALGCVIKGETPHFDFLCNSIFISLLGLSTKSNKPIGNGIITALNMSQAKKRSLIKGREAVHAVLEVIKNG